MAVTIQWHARTLVVSCVGGLLVVLSWLYVHSSPWSPTLRLRHGSVFREADLLDDVFNHTLGFQKIFVINIPSRTDHRDSMSLAAALTDLRLDYVDGVVDFDDKLLPPGVAEAKLSKGTIGAWRAHMNVARKIVEENITSALIFEGDIDWDIRIKAQMRQFAKASQLLLQPDRNQDEMNLGEETIATPSSTSPYGEIHLWDMLWVGHCGAVFPGSANDGGPVPAGRVVIGDDDTVPELKDIDPEYGYRREDNPLVNDYPPHTRVVSRARTNVCSLAYGLSQRGARRFLHQLGIRRLNSAADIMFREMCDGLAGRPMHTCLTVQPQLFQHHIPVGPTSTLSSIADHSGGYNNISFTKNVRWATKVNFANLVYENDSYITQYEGITP